MRFLERVRRRRSEMKHMADRDPEVAVSVASSRVLLETNARLVRELAALEKNMRLARQKKVEAP